MGGFCGIACINDDGTADYTVKSDVKENEDNVFKFSFDKNGDFLMDTNNYAYSCGAGVSYDKCYTKKTINSPVNEKFGWIFSDNQELQFKQMTGKYYDDFLAYNQYQSVYNVIDDFNAKAVTIGVLGYQNVGIIMLNSEDGSITAAISSIHDGLLYFSNSTKHEKTPKTIQEWLGAREYKVVTNDNN